MKIDNDILMAKNESYFNTKNRHNVIRNDTLIITTNCIKSKTMIRENVKSLKNIKNYLYSANIVSKLILKSYIKSLLIILIKE